MAASASRASSTYDVFLSFRGADTRKGFTDHLYNALVREGIHTFRDDDEIKSGTEIGPECLKAIEESRFSIVILSKGYASSTWCLDELVHILECRDRHGHVVWPVFYNVDPSEVEEVRGSFEEAFAGHQECFREAMEKVERWKCALKEVAYLKGLDLQRHFDGHEAKNIDFIVKEISRRLDRTMLSVAAHPVGLNSRANHVISLVADESVDVGMVGIYGMGGIGKTTIAKEVYNSIFRNFDGCCFLENVRQRSVDKGITYLQRQLLTEILKAKHEKIDTADRGQNIISERLRRKRVLLVLDDVDKLEQLNKILGNGSWLYSGSRVIITTRIRGLLPPSSKLYQQYEVPALDFGDSLQLLSKHAFNSSHPEGSFLDCATKVASYAGGIPLALEVLGSSLCGQSIEVWISRVEKLKLIGNEDVHSKLRISYDSLDDTEKSLFLDIACFFIGKRKGYVMSILDDCGFFATDGINTLMRRCLVSIGNHSELVMMHDLLRDMGREIVRQESPKDPGERSRIWRDEDVLDVLNDKLGTKAVEGIILNNPGLRQLFSAKTFKKMKRLRLLQLNYVRLTGSCEYISSKLRWICWRKFPYDSIPSDLNLENLVALEMRYGNMEQFFEEENVRLLRYKSISVAYQFRKVYTYVILILQYLLQSLKKLKFINLNHSHQLKRTPNFEGFTSLEELMLKDCIRLEEIDESIGLAPSLRILNLQDCKNLKHLPGSICGLRSLLKLNISGCNKLEDLPEELGNLQSLVTLTADETPISTLPETISSLENLQHLSLRGCHSVFSLEKNTPIINFLPSSLKELDLRYCNIVDSMIPDDLRGLPLLQNFKLCGNNFTSLPASVCGLPMLYSLWLNECKRLRSIPQLPSSVNQLQADNCPSLVSIDLTNVHGASAFQFSGCRSLHEIKGFFNFESLRPEVVGALLKNGLSAQELIANSSETLMIDNLTATYRSSSLQALCERGTYSIFLPGNEIPIWFGHQSEGDTVSFHVPPLDHEEGSKIVGIVTCCIYSWKRPSQSCYFFPDVTIINKTKMFHWVYTPYVTFLSKDVEQDIMWVCYWSFDHLEPGVDEVDMNWRFKNELEQGDLLEFSVDMGFGIVPKRCGVHLLYHQEDLAVIRGSSTHRRRFLRSIPRWLTMENPQEITPEMWKNSSGNEEFSLWSKRREQRVNKTPDYDRTYKTGFPY